MRKLTAGQEGENTEPQRHIYRSTDSKVQIPQQSLGEHSRIFIEKKTEKFLDFSARKAYIANTFV